MLAQVLDLELVSVKDEDIAKISSKYLKRNIEIHTFQFLKSMDFPIFIKSVIPKLFKAQVFQAATNERLL